MANINVIRSNDISHKAGHVKNICYEYSYYCRPHAQQGGSWMCLVVYIERLRSH